uniref:C2 domain-containing protein n=1 Tax=Buteo japonicus TaxID=224669 RepID=A0A8C0HM16_9AVES
LFWAGWSDPFLWTDTDVVIEQKHPYYNLTVKVLRARNIKGTDLLSKADCYVEIKLPTASPIVSRTQVVDNSDNPEWNETFQYRIHSAVKVRSALCGAGWDTPAQF